MSSKSKTSSVIEDAFSALFAISDIVSENLSKSIDNAGEALTTEIMIRKLKNQREKKIYELGHITLVTSAIYEDLIKEIKQIDEDIRQMEDERKKDIKNQENASVPKQTDDTSLAKRQKEMCQQT